MSPSSPPPASPPSPHDHLFKFAFSDPDKAADLAKSALSPALAAQIDWPRLEATRGHFVDPELREKQTDLLFVAPLADGRRALLYLLFEHQHHPDAWMAFRVLVYIVRIWGEWRRDHPDAKRLPPIVPIIVHQGPQGWTAARELSELIDLSPEQLPLFAEHLPELRLTIDDLALHTEAQIRQRSSHAIVALVLLFLRDLQTSPDPLANLGRYVDLFAKVAHAPGSLDAMEALLRYTLGTTDVALDDVIAVIRPHIDPKEVDTVISTARMIYDNGIKTGLERGREEGRKEGRESAQVQTLLRLITKRYGTEPADEVRRRVEEATGEQRERWIEGIFEANTVEDLLR